jgi:hypothetical protein
MPGATFQQQVPEGARLIHAEEGTERLKPLLFKPRTRMSFQVFAERLTCLDVFVSKLLIKSMSAKTFHV